MRPLGAIPVISRTIGYHFFEQGRVREAWQAVTAYTEAHGGNSRQRLLAAAVRCLSWEMYKFNAYRSWAQARRQARLRQNPWFSEDLTKHFINEDVPPVLRHCRTH
jgi:asparagine synthase (glutamine-hydrolysing)